VGIQPIDCRLAPTGPNLFNQCCSQYAVHVILNCQHNEMKLKQNSFKTILKPFCQFRFVVQTVLGVSKKCFVISLDFRYSRHLYGMDIIHVSVMSVLLLVSRETRADNTDEYTNDFAVEIEGDLSVADLVAGTHSLRVVRQACIVVTILTILVF